MDNKKARRTIERYVPGVFIYYWNCGMPWHSYVRQYGTTLYLVWKEHFDNLCVKFPYSEGEFTERRIQINRHKIMTIYSLPKATEVGDCETSICFWNGKLYDGCYINLVLNENNTLTICGRARNGYFYHFGEVDRRKYVRQVKQWFDVILNTMCTNRITGEITNDNS